MASLPTPQKIESSSTCCSSPANLYSHHLFLFSSHPRKWSQHLLSTCCAKIGTILPLSSKIGQTAGEQRSFFFPLSPLLPPICSWVLSYLVLFFFFCNSRFFFSQMAHFSPACNHVKSSLVYKTSKEIPWFPSLSSFCPLSSPPHSTFVRTIDTRSLHLLISFTFLWPLNSGFFCYIWR